jgi:hypothetical protein
MAYTHDRLLMLPTVGTAWVLSAYIVDAFSRQKTSRNVDGESSGVDNGSGELKNGTEKSKTKIVHWLSIIGAAIFLVVHGLVAPVQAVLRTMDAKEITKKTLKVAVEAEMPGPGEAENARVLVLSTPSMGTTIFGIRLLAGFPYPEAVWLVTMGTGEYKFTRTGPASFSIKVLSDDFLRGMGPRTWLEDFVFVKGERFRRGVMEVVITDVDEEGRIREFSVSIDLPLDHPDVWLLTFNGQRYVRISLPPWDPDADRR